MMRHALVAGLAAAVAATAPWMQASAQSEDPVAADFDKFRAIMEQDNPAELASPPPKPGGIEPEPRTFLSNACMYMNVSSLVFDISRVRPSVRWSSTTPGARMLRNVWLAGIGWSSVT